MSFLSSFSAPYFGFTLITLHKQCFTQHLCSELNTFCTSTAKRIKYFYCPLQSWSCVHSQVQHKEVPIDIIFYVSFRIHHIHPRVTWVMCIWFIIVIVTSHWYDTMIRVSGLKSERWNGCYWYHTLTCCHVNNIVCSVAKLKWEQSARRDIVQDVHTMDLFYG